MAPSEKQAEERQASLREEVLEKGTFAALEGDDNAVAVSDAAYVGVDSVYANYGDDALKPYDFDEDTVEGQQANRQRNSVFEIQADAAQRGVRGYAVTPVHPSEAVKVGEPARQAARLREAALDKQAQETLSDEEKEAALRGQSVGGTGAVSPDGADSEQAKKDQDAPKRRETGEKPEPTAPPADASKQVREADKTEK